MSSFGLSQASGVDRSTLRGDSLVEGSSSAVQSSLPLTFGRVPLVSANRSYQPLIGGAPNSTYSYVPLGTWYSRVLPVGRQISYYPANLQLPENPGGPRLSRVSLEESYGAPIAPPKKKKKLGCS